MTAYRRRLSREDVETGSLLITKGRWGMFPPPLQEFEVEVGGQRFVTTVAPEDCARSGEPHQHYHLEAEHFRHLLDFVPGAAVVIERTRRGYRMFMEGKRA